LANQARLKSANRRHIILSQENLSINRYFRTSLGFRTTNSSFFMLQEQQEQRYELELKIYFIAIIIDSVALWFVKHRRKNCKINRSKQMRTNIPMLCWNFGFEWGYF
jgi:hypothetical protein